MPILSFIILSIVTVSYATTTCGYQDGNPQSARTAGPGYECRVDTANGLWGFCPETVMAARDCGLAGVCVDSHSCTRGCGRLFNRRDITTFSCEKSQFCSTVLLINGPDQSFEYIACGAEATTARLLPVPNAAVATTPPSSFASVPNSSVTGSTSLPTATVVQSSSVLGTSSSFGTTSATMSSTAGPVSASTQKEPMNIGAIVGGAIGGLTVICVTILGIVLIRRNHGVEGKVMSPSDHSLHGRDEPGSVQKTYQWDSSHGPVEMYSGHHMSIEPVELPGQAQYTDNPKEAR